MAHPDPYYHLPLSQKEILVLKKVLENVGGDPLNSARAISDRIYFRLCDKFHSSYASTMKIGALEFADDREFVLSEGYDITFNMEANKTVKEEVSNMATKSVFSSAVEVFSKTEEAILVSKWMPTMGISDNFAGKVFLETNKYKVLLEAERLEEEAKVKK